MNWILTSDSVPENDDLVIMSVIEHGEEKVVVGLRAFVPKDPLDAESHDRDTWFAIEDISGRFKSYADNSDEFDSHLFNGVCKAWMRLPEKCEA